MIDHRQEFLEGRALVYMATKCFTGSKVAEVDFVVGGDRDHGGARTSKA